MVWRWSKTAATNSSADSTINWAEGQAPSSVNDSARAEMARVAQWRDDISGTIATGGTSTAYTVTSNQTFDTLAHMDGAIIAFVPHTTSGAAPTLNVDSLGAKKIRFQTGVDLPAGVFIQATPYVATYYNSVGEFLIHNLAGNPYNVPLLGGMDYWDTVAPNGSFIFPLGQALSRTTYATTFARWGTTYGSGDGSTTFNAPDKGERVSVMKVGSASRLTATYFGGDSTAMGAVGGLESHTLTTAQLASHNHTLTDPGHTHLLDVGQSGGAAPRIIYQAASNNAQAPTVSTTTGISIAAAGSGNAHNNVQPSIVCNYIIRVL